MVFSKSRDLNVMMSPISFKVACIPNVVNTTLLERKYHVLSKTLNLISSISIGVSYQPFNPNLVIITLVLLKGNCDGFSKLIDLNAMTSPVAASLVLKLVNSPTGACCPNLLVVGFMEVEMTILKIFHIFWKKLNSLPRSTILDRFPNSEFHCI